MNYWSSVGPCAEPSCGIFNGSPVSEVGHCDGLSFWKVFWKGRKGWLWKPSLSGFTVCEDRYGVWFLLCRWENCLFSAGHTFDHVNLEKALKPPLHSLTSSLISWSLWGQEVEQSKCHHWDLGSLIAPGFCHLVICGPLTRVFACVFFVRSQWVYSNVYGAAWGLKGYQVLKDAKSVLPSFFSCPPSFFSPSSCVFYLASLPSFNSWEDSRSSSSPVKTPLWPVSCRECAPLYKYPKEHSAPFCSWESDTIRLLSMVQVQAVRMGWQWPTCRLDVPFTCGEAYNVLGISTSLGLKRLCKAEKFCSGRRSVHVLAVMLVGSGD